MPTIINAPRSNYSFQLAALILFTQFFNSYSRQLFPEDGNSTDTTSATNIPSLSQTVLSGINSTIFYIEHFFFYLNIFHSFALAYPIFRQIRVEFPGLLPYSGVRFAKENAAPIPTYKSENQEKEDERCLIATEKLNKYIQLIPDAEHRHELILYKSLITKFQQPTCPITLENLKDGVLAHQKLQKGEYLEIFLDVDTLNKTLKSTRGHLPCMQKAGEVTRKNTKLYYFKINPTGVVCKLYSELTDKYEEIIKKLEPASSLKQNSSLKDQFLLFTAKTKINSGNNSLDKKLETRMGMDNTSNTKNIEDIQDIKGIENVDTIENNTIQRTLF